MNKPAKAVPPRCPDQNITPGEHAPEHAPEQAPDHGASRPGLSRRGFLGAAVAGSMAVAAGAATPRDAAANSRSAAAPVQPATAPASVAPLSRAETKSLGIATLAAYERAVDLWAVTDGTIFNQNVQPQWLAQTHQFWYAIERKGGSREYMIVDMATGQRRRAFDEARLAEGLKKVGGGNLNQQNPAINIISLSPEKMTFNLGERGFSCDLKNYAVAGHGAAWPQPLAKAAFPPTDPNRWSSESPDSPNGRWHVAVREFNVFLKDRHSSREIRLTSDGTPEHHFDPRVFWSPDSAKFIVLRTQPGFDRQVKELDYAVPQNQATLVSFFYRKPGDRVNITRPHLFHVSPAREIPVPIDTAPNPWSITEVRWNAHSQSFSYLYNQRGHQVMRVLEVNATTGKTRTIVEELCHDDHSPKFFDYSGKQFTFYLPATGEVIWMSERDGWNHLYLFDLYTGRLKNQITQGDWVVRGVEWVDPVKRQIWFRAGGIFSQQDPYFVHYCRVNFDGSHLTRLTKANGTHSVVFSPDRQYLVDTWSRVDAAPVVELRRADRGTFVCHLETADITQWRKTGLPLPQPFVAKGRDGKTDIYGVIYRPTHFDPRRQYPLIEYIYAGPQAAFVPKAFKPFHWPQTMAEIGFIVVQIDGMGTSYRSKPFHDVCWKNLGDSGFPDRIPWIKAAQKRACPQMDLSRVGIYGTSAGGQSALRALLAFGEFYKVASANSGCHDNRVDKIWWNEQWMGWPIGPWYAAQSNVTNAHKLSGSLLLIAGGMDHNVDPCCTMQVINAMQKANKDLEFVFVPPGHHGAAGYHWQYTWRQVRDFMVRRLWHIQPRGGQILPLALATPIIPDEFKENIADA